MDFEDEEDLNRAIALSMQQSSKQRSSITDEEMENDEYDDDLRRALEASKVESYPRSSTGTISREPGSSTTTMNPQPIDKVVHSRGTKTFLSERAQLERERLKRIRKAQGLPEESDEELGRSKDIVQDEDEDEDEIQPASKPAVGASASSFNGAELFWNGELRPTATAGVEPRKDGKKTFRLTQILGEKTDISFAVISTFALDLPWIYQFFERGTPVILVTQPGIKDVLPDLWIKTEVPLLKGGYGCMHMKFMLLFYKTGRLRIAITSANLNPFDWRDIENAAWIQDLAPLGSPCVFDKKATTHFQYMMKNVLDGLNVKPALATLLKQGHPNLPIKTTEEICTRWNWSKIRVHLVPSMAGKHEGWSQVIQTGHTRLMKVVRDLGLRTGVGGSAKGLQVEYQGSSLGNYTTSWLNEWYWSARGESAETWLDESKRKREKLPFPSMLQILFPTRATVLASQYGERGGGTNFCRRAQWQATNFPRHLFRDSKSKAGPTLMHTKTILSTFVEKPVVTSSGRSSKRPNVEILEISDDSGTDSDDEIQFIESAVGWAYIGSHNFTPSAWGTLSGSSFNPIMNIRNYELGIVLPLKAKEDIDKVAFWERPAQKYDGKEPWIQEESEYFKQS